MTLVAVEPSGDSDGSLERKDLDLVVGRNLVVTVHDGPLSAIDELRRAAPRRARPRQLDAGAFLTGLVDAVIAGYLARGRGDRARDRPARHAGPEGGRRTTTRSWTAVVALRRRIAVLRRSPHAEPRRPRCRSSGPDFEVHDDIFEPWPGIVDRLERAIDAVENARETLVGSFDIYLGRSAQHSNDVMKVLTLVSAIALPAIVLAGVMGMNFELRVLRERQQLLSSSSGRWSRSRSCILAVARWRRWI